jgi:multidrug efflux pump subunit AcrA (membrane-fusion protein)
MRFARQIFRFALTLASLAFAAAAFAEEEPAEAQGMAVSVVKAKTTCFVDHLQVNGHVVAREEILVYPDVEGLQIARLLVDDGAIVAEGEPLAQLVRPDYLPGTPAKATLKAPANGTLLFRQVAVGMPVSARGEAPFRIIRDSELELLVELPLGALAKVKPGQATHIVLLDATELAGTVRLILPEIDPRTQLAHARIKMRGEANIRPGAFARATVDLGRSCGTAIPLSAILYGPEGSIVQVVRDDRVETRRVKVGLSEGDDVEIREGLTNGDAVVAKAGAFLREGDLVRPMP